MQEHCIRTSSNICFGYFLESPHWGDSNKYPKHIFYAEISIKQESFLHTILSINDSLQQQIHYNGNIFGNNCCRCNEGSLYKINRGTAFPAGLHIRPVKTPISLCIRTGWSESYLSAWRRFGSLASGYPQSPCKTLISADDLSLRGCICNSVPNAVPWFKFYES